MHNTTIIFTSGRGPVAWLIKKFTKSKASHVMIGTGFHGQCVLVHAHLHGVDTDLRSRYLKSSRLVAEYEILAEVDVGNAISRLGVDYDKLNIIGQAMARMAKWVRIKMGNPFRDPDTFVCSELVLEIDPKGNIEEWKGIDREMVSPQDLMEICESSKMFRKIEQ